MIAADYPFLDVVWTMFIFFAWVIWFWILITVFGDIFRRRDTSGFGKVLWLIFVIVVPYFGVFIYLIANHDGMAERNIQQAQARYCWHRRRHRSTVEARGSRSIGP